MSGFGFWSGLDTSIEFRPAEANTGLVFVRTDLPKQPRIGATISNRITGPRRTTLVENRIAVEMVEHVLAALAGLQIDNCELHVSGAEMPGLDGSSQPFVNALQLVDRVEQRALRPILEVTEPVRVESGDAWIEAKPAEQPTLRLNYQLNYPGVPTIGSQSFSIELNRLNRLHETNRQTFAEQLAPARTFLLATEAAQLQHQGLGDRVSYRDVLVFGDQGPIQNRLRFPDECARHKTLDMIGDFALAGHDLIGNFTAVKSGHLLNAQMVSALLQQHSSSLPIRQTA